MESMQNTMTRRRFVELLGACGALAAFSTYGIAANRAEAAGQYAETIVFAQGADPRGLDPALVDDMESGNINVNVYETLINYAPTSCDLVPGLAKDWEVSEDGLIYTFHLQEGVKFHDGTPFNADAVVFSVERQLEPNRTEEMPYASFVFGSIADETGVEYVKAIDDLTVEMKLRAVNTPFLKNMAMCMAAPIVSPTAVEKYGNLMKVAVGTGPYKFVSWSEGENVILTRFDEYWNKDAAALTKNVIFRFIPENASRVVALTNGEVDIINGIDDTVVPMVTAAGYKLFDLDGMNINYMAFNTKSKNFSNLDARLAICKAINVPEMVKALYGDYAGVANSVMPLWMAPYAKDVPFAEFDPTAAKAELAALGINKVRMITYSNVRQYNTKGGQVLAETIMGYLAKVGVDVTIDTYDWTTYKSKVQTEEYDICYYGWNGDNGDPDNFMNLLSDPNWSMNVARWDDPEYRALIVAGQTTPEGPERDAIYQACEEMVAAKRPWLTISHAKNLCAYSPKIQNFVLHPTTVVFFNGITKLA